jgi:hypothetical protein
MKAAIDARVPLAIRRHLAAKLIHYKIGVDC